MDTLLNQRYRLETSLGQGGGGTIYRAYDTVLDRSVAVKVLASNNLGSQGRVRLLREAKAAARLNHPNIVSVFDAGESDGVSFIVMELVEGVTLHEYKPADLDEILNIYRQICVALEHAHLHEIVHRDLKPENVLFTKDRVAKLTDFGLSRPVASRLSNEGEITGTVYYLAPEQALGQDADIRADLYSLGVMLYESVTGQLPFDGDNPIAIISQHLYAPVVPPRLRQAKIPLALDSLILQLLSKSAADRPSSAGEVLIELSKLAQTNPQQDFQEKTFLERITRGRMVGREKELNDARAIWQNVLRGEGQLVLISGEPGVGKSRLVREIATLVEVTNGIATLGECYPEGNAPYAPFTQMVRQVVTNNSLKEKEVAKTILADIILIIPELQSDYPDVLPNPALDPQAEQQRLFDNLASFFINISRNKPALLILEDAHWADEGTLALLRHLVRRARQQRILILATYREVELDENLPLNETLNALQRERLITRLKLTRLDRQATHLMLDTLLGDQTPEVLLDRIYQETEGNPFFTEEVCKALVEDGKISYVDGRLSLSSGESLQIPQSIRVTIQTRINKLPAEQQDVLRMAAILGREFDFQLLSAALEMDEDLLIDALDNAQRSQIIDETNSNFGGVFRFVHALLPLTLVESISGLRRRRMHRRAGEAIEKLRPDDLEAIAYQYSQAEDTEKAYVYLKKAGERSQARYANSDAIRYFSNALEFCESDDRVRFEILALRVQVYDLVAMRGQQLADIGEMQEIANRNNDDTLRFEAIIGLTDYYTNTEFTRAQQLSQDALELAQKLGDDKRQAIALYRLARAAWRSGNLHHSVSMLLPALDIFKNLQLFDETIRTYYLLSLNYTNLGEYEAGQAAAEEALKLSRQKGIRRFEATSLRRLGIAYSAQSKPQEALTNYQAALKIHREVGDRAEECNDLNAIATILIELGQLAEAKEYFLQGITIAEAAGNDFTIGMLTFNYVYNCFIQQGDYEAGLDYLSGQSEKAHQLDDKSLIFVSARLQSEILCELGQYPAALDAALEAVKMAELRKEERNQIDLLSWSGRIAALAGKSSDAQNYLQSSFHLMEQSAEPEFYVDPYFNWAYTAWLGDTIESWEKALTYTQRVIDLSRQVKSKYALRFALDMHARLLLALGRVDKALSCTSEMIDLIEETLSISSIAHFNYTHSSALKRSGKTDEAKKYLEMAYQNVMKLSNSLKDERLQDSWLNAVQYNRAIIQEWGRLTAIQTQA